ncbi:MAG: hypothetical protein GWP05_06605 [Anaerolineaceae bacterium]|nr:hypothetical protein [Anaerolineaceae bacterium]
MKAGIVAVVLAAVVVAAGITYSFIRQEDGPVDRGPPVTAGPDSSSKIVQVDDLAKSPEDFKGRIVLRAVVVGLKESEGVFGVIDSREFESCGRLTCAETILPVRFSGRLPGLKTVVEITGRVVRGEKGLIIDAEGVEVAP